MTISTKNPASSPPPDYRGRAICYYHPNSKGTGSALRLEPRVNRHGDDRYNCFFIELASQKSTVNPTTGTSAYATFDWDAKITVKLGLLDVSEMLLVLEGRLAKVGGNNRGLYHACQSGNTLISFSRNEERESYYLALSRKFNGRAEPVRCAIQLSAVEAASLRYLLQMGLFFVTFPAALRTRPPPISEPRPPQAGTAA